MRASHEALVELVEPMKDFFDRLGVYTQIPLSSEMAEVLVKIVAEIFSILSIATKEVKRKSASESIPTRYTSRLTDLHILSEIYFRKLLGRTEIEDAMKKLNNLIDKEVPMAIAQTMRGT